jgi:hypothetical protein
MLRNSRSRRTCTWGCCGDKVPNRTLRTREKARWKKETR